MDGDPEAERRFSDAGADGDIVLEDDEESLGVFDVEDEDDFLIVEEDK
jgi:hypothetical protein